jgi:hypothetical protein
MSNPLPGAAVQCNWMSARNSRAASGVKLPIDDPG